ncbi:MAG: YajQ family cyclic di-GMP-binding protein [Oligoflexia bacterium]|nr:YajQ family cyclic di-GMP-binding protein [Oligoflexia bacterium]
MPSFDVVSEVNLQEVTNAVDQTRREISTRYDFKDSKSSVELKVAEIHIVADDNMKLKAVQDILRQKLSKRGVSLKMVVFEDPIPGGGDTLKQTVKVKQGLQDEELKRVNKAIKEMKFKVTSQIQGNQLRVTGKKRDDLQEVIGALKGQIQDLELQFTNFRE